MLCGHDDDELPVMVDDDRHPVLCGHDDDELPVMVDDD